MSDNGGQFKSDLFETFAKNYGFRQVFTAPYFPQANGEAESAVKITKRDSKAEGRVRGIDGISFYACRGYWS